ncbi:MAG TPA: GNAT family N-acetyltransferase [Pyrinomonadaceae bacterium]
MEGFSIRTATEKDAGLIAVLGATTFYEAYFEQDEPKVLTDYIVDSFSVEKIRDELADPNSSFYVADLNDRAIGYARLIRDSRLASVEGDRVVELRRIYLVERHWGKRFGEKLLFHCIDEGRRFDADTLWLTVWWKNTRGISFYRRHGFARVGTLEFKFGDFEETNDIMQLTL